MSPNELLEFQINANLRSLTIKVKALSSFLTDEQRKSYNKIVETEKQSFLSQSQKFLTADEIRLIEKVFD